MSTEELIEKYSNENGFLFGIDTVMQVLRPNAIYCLKVENGNFEIVSWDKLNDDIPPNSNEIKEEYIKHKAIKETLDYINRRKK